MRSRLATIAFVLITVMLLASCAEQGQNAGGAPPDTPVTSSPNPGGPGPGPEPTPLMVTPRPGLTDPRPHALDGVDIEDDRTLLLKYYGGVEECYGLDHVDVQYGRDDVTVTVYEGRVPGARVCIEIAVFKAVRVHLDEPLGGRKVVDGAA
ncbi:MAG: hypothetical protein ACRDHO_06635 [Actinomycetota bacterium]